MWFPAGLNMAERIVRFRKVAAEPFSRVPFHDGRDPFLQSLSKSRSFDDIIARFKTIPPPGHDKLILHQSFCGSTFLAKLLTISRHSESYREPQILVELSEASDVPEGLTEALISYFRRSPDHTVSAFTKPSNWVNAYLIQSGALTSAKLVLVSIELQDFLVANLRGGKERIRYSLNLLNYLLRFAPQWKPVIDEVQAKQAENPLLSTLQLFSVLHSIQTHDFERLTRESQNSVLHLSMHNIKDKPLDSAVAASKHLELDLKIEDIAARYQEVSEVHAKSLERRGFNAVMEATLNKNIAQTYKDDLSRAVTWAQGQARIRA